MEKIGVLDLNNDGHHWFYNSTLLKNIKNYELIYFTKDLTEGQKNYLVENNIDYINYEFGGNSILYKLIGKLQILNKIFNECKTRKIDKLIILFLDDILMQIPFYLNKDIKLLSVLHWFPRERRRRNCLSKYVQNNSLIVHTNGIKNKFNDNIANVKVINYPITERLKGKKNMFNTTKPVVLYFGGTRYDKGIDILIKALKKVKCDYYMVIIGKEEHFKKENIVKELGNIDYYLKMDFVSEQEMADYFSSSDFVVLPYRNIFMGESGIMTEAIAYGKPLIMPNIMHFPQIVKEYKNGIIYDVEDVDRLAESIEMMINQLEKFNRQAKKAQIVYNEKHSIEQFVKEYQKLIDTL